MIVIYLISLCNYILNPLNCVNDDSQIHQQYLYSLCSTMPLQYVATSDVNRPEKKDQVLKTYAYAYCMAKLKIFIYMLWLVIYG